MYNVWYTIMITRYNINTQCVCVSRYIFVHPSNLESSIQLLEHPSSRPCYSHLTLGRVDCFIQFFLPDTFCIIWITNDSCIFCNFLTVLQHIDWILTWRISFKSKSILHFTFMPQWLTQAVIHIPETRAWDRPQFSPLRIVKPLSSWNFDGKSLGSPGGEVAGDIGLDAFKARLGPTNLFAPNVLDFDQKQNINNLLQEKNS